MPSTGVQTRTPVDRAFVAATIERLRRTRARSGSQLPDGMLAAAAEACGVAPSTMRRYVAQGPPQGRRGPEPWAWSPTAREAYYRAAGNVPLARSILLAEDPSAELPSIPTMYRASQRDFAPDERALARRGARAAQAKRLVCSIEHRYRNEVWLADHRLLDVVVSVPRGRRPIRPWMTVIIDGYSRRVVGASLSTTPNRGHVLAALGMAIRECGLPETLVFDRGREFLSDAVSEHAAALGYPATPTLPYHPHHKGKVERLHATLNRRFAAAMGTVPAPARDERNKPLFAVPGSLPFEFAVRRFYEMLDGYSAAPHRALEGRSPLEVYADDATPERPADEAVLRRFLLASATRRITDHGIRFEKRTYWASKLEGHRGETVEIRWAQDDPRQLEVFRDGRHWCTDGLVDPASPEQHARVIRARREHTDRQRADLRRARRKERERWKAIAAADDGVVETTPVTVGDYRGEVAHDAAAHLSLLADLGLETDLDAP